MKKFLIVFFTLIIHFQVFANDNENSKSYEGTERWYGRKNIFVLKVLHFVYKNQERVSALKGMTLSFDLVPTEQFLKAHRLLKCALKLVLYGNSRAKFLCVNSLKSKK